MSFNFDEKLLQTFPSSDLVRIIHASLALPGSHLRVFLLSPNLLVKVIPAADADDEIAGMELSRQLDIRVPDIRRIIKNESTVYIIMDRISGTTLEDSWPQTGWLATLRLGFQLRRYVRAMRALTSPTAGSLLDGKCNSVWLDDYYRLPPSATPEAITSFIRFWLQYVSKARQTLGNKRSIHDQPFVPPTSTTLVFTHQDLAPRILLVGRDGEPLGCGLATVGLVSYLLRIRFHAELPRPRTGAGRPDSDGGYSAGFRSESISASTWLWHV